MSEELKTPAKWAWFSHLKVIDPDGWRIDGKSFDEPITKREWLHRSAVSTVQFVDDDPWEPQTDAEFKYQEQTAGWEWEVDNDD